MREFMLFFAKGGPVPLALRQLRAHLLAPIPCAALAGVAVILGISGPFGTIDAFGLLARLGYWGAVVPLTYAAGYLGTRSAQAYWPAGPRVWRIALTALGAALAVAPVLAGFNAALGIPLGEARDLALGFAAVYVICLVIETISWVLQNHGASAAPPNTGPALMARLPLAKRGALLALSGEDHYTRVLTDKGEALVLIRLSDAIAQTAPIQGLHIHRSHWVALSAIASALRTGDSGAVTLHTGHTLPIARTRIRDLRAQGLFPAKGDQEGRMNG